MKIAVLWRNRHEKSDAPDAALDYSARMERPSTIHGLIHTRRELVARLERSRGEIKSYLSGIDAIDVALKLFGADGTNAKPMRLPPAHPARKGEFQRIALDLLRETGEPISSHMVAKRFCDIRELNLDDAAFKSVRYRASSGLCNMQIRRMIRRIGPKGPEARWKLVDGFDVGRARYWDAEIRDVRVHDDP